MRPVRDLTIKIQASRAEKTAWELSADGEPLSVWIRQTLNARARHRETRINERAVRTGVEEETFTLLPAEDANPEIEPTAPEARGGESRTHAVGSVAAPLLAREGEFDPECANAAQHWQLARGVACPDCGGFDR